MDGPDVTRSSPSAALRYRDFRLYQAARFAGVVGTQILSVAVGWHVYDVTRRPLDLGYVGLAQFVPAFALALPAGHLADRLDRRVILAACQAAYVVTAGALLAAFVVAPLAVKPIYGVLILFGCARGLAGPAGQALMPDLVPIEHLGNAIAWGSSAFQVAIIVGPAVGGLTYAWGGAKLAYATAALLFGAAFLAYGAIRAIPARAAKSDRTLRSVLAGVEYVWRKKVVLGSISLDLFAVLLGGATALLPVYARDILHVGPSGLGALRSAPAVGAALTAVFLAYRPMRRRAGLILFACVGLFGLSTILFGVSRSFGLSLAALVVLGAADLVSVVVRHTVVQIKTPPEMRGRVSAVNVVFIGASNELGEFESGVTAALWGTVPSVVIGGIGTCIVVAIWAWLFPELRRVDDLHATDV